MRHNLNGAVSVIEVPYVNVVWGEFLRFTFWVLGADAFVIPSIEVLPISAKTAIVVEMILHFSLFPYISVHIKLFYFNFHAGFIIPCKLSMSH